VLYKHPAVQECAVIGVPDQEWGEMVTAYIKTKPAAAIEAKEVKTFLKTRLSAYKVPKQFHIIDDFPRSPAGKILKRKLRDLLKKA
jgi:acyl-CoA synthetase (AMP-forming)/AMP-acid ligase II